MFDPIACATMTVGSPLVTWSVLVELRQRLLDARPSEVSSKEAEVIREERDEKAGDAGTTGGDKAVEPVVRRREDKGAGCGRAAKGRAGSDADPDASRRLGHGGSRR